MATTYPRVLLEADCKSPAEQRVFGLLRSRLADGWEVFHSAGWVVRDPGEGAKDGEIDFVLCHPDHAIICLEVKGGGIQCRYGEWSRKQEGEWERMRDPFQQALDHRYALERLIDTVDGRRGKDLFIVHAVALPDVSVHSLQLAPDAPPEILVDRNDVEDPDAWVERVLAFHAGAREKRKVPGTAGAAMLRDLIAPTFEIDVSLAHLFAQESADLVQLTHEQSALLGRKSREPRMVVRGCAGSGKTMLAVEHARRLSQGARDVLFVCFNRRLREHLQATVADEGITFHTFHGLCVAMARRAGVELPDYPQDDTPPEFWLDELPEALVDAMAELGPQWDALVVDEAQDLHTHWLTALQSCLRDEQRDPVWLFMDDNQRVYEAMLEVPDEWARHELTVNCRNTQEIHREVVKKYKGEVAPDVLRGPSGREPELLITPNPVDAVAGVLERLCGTEEVAPQDVVVLSSHALERSDFATGFSGRWRLTEKRNQPGDYVQFSSIRGFKGLESPAVVLCELEDIDDMTRDQQIYVGMSRARNHCVIVVPQA
jgi:hypothetical protein